MNYWNSTLLAFICSCAIFLFGPLALLPMTWWLVYGREVEANNRTVRFFSRDKFIIATAVLGIVTSWAILILFPEDKVEIVINTINSYSVINTGWQKALIKINENKIYLKYILNNNISYLSSILFIFIVFILVGSRVENFRILIRKSLPKSKNVTKKKFVSALLFVVAITLSFHLLIYFHPGSSFKTIYYGVIGVAVSGFVLLLTAMAEIVIWVFIQRYSNGELS